MTGSKFLFSILRDSNEVFFMPQTPQPRPGPVSNITIILGLKLLLWLKLLLGLKRPVERLTMTLVRLKCGKVLYPFRSRIIGL